MKDGELNPLDAPDDRVYFLSPMQFQCSDLSSLGAEELIELQKDTGYMLRVMQEHPHIQKEPWVIKRAPVNEQE